MGRCSLDIRQTQGAFGYLSYQMLIEIEDQLGHCLHSLEGMNTAVKIYCILIILNWVIRNYAQRRSPWRFTQSIFEPVVNAWFVGAPDKQLFA